MRKSSIKKIDKISPPVSVIITIVNEEKYLARAVDAVLNSDYKGKIEILLAVGPSRDKSREIADELALRDKRIRVFENPTGKTPNGLNIALKRSRHQIIVRIDGHSEIEPSYISTAVQILGETGAVNVGGIMDAQGLTDFQRAVASAMRSKIGVGAARFHTGGWAGPADTVYLGVFKKSALEAVGGYNENFIRAQDWELNHRLRLNGGLIWFDPSLKVRYRPRSSIMALGRQYFEYGRWRRALSKHHRGTINFRYLAPPLNFLLTLLSISAGFLLSKLFFIPLFSYLTLIILSSQFIGKNWRERLLLPTVLLTMHYAWGFGFITSPRKLLPS